jgi:hypothetical protein
MNAMWPEADIAATHRPPMHARIDDGVCLRNRMRVVAAEGTGITNAGLTFRGRGVTGPGPGNPLPLHGGIVALHSPLNGFFAISVNDPSMSMVNFSCCVVSALPARARGAMRRVAPHPDAAAVGMEVGVDVQV